MTDQRSGIRLEEIALTLGTQEFSFDCAFESGKVTAVVGPSGSGKSTLLNLVAGFESPDAGRVLIKGEDVSGLDPSQRPVSLVFQDNNLFAHLDIATNVGLGIDPSLRLSDQDKDAVGKALQRVGLGGFDRRLPSKLSGGERQRVAFARALVRKRPCMLLDEPFAALDPGLRAEMAMLLKDLHRENNNTVLLVTHHPDDIRRLADAVVFLNDGRIVFQGRPASFFAAADNAQIASFLYL